ncbi:hypothetical protein SEA_OCTOBIEN14_92 [Gordonia phage Octobien14]|uniref:Uncharacterized protein n=1 Tax=Gordonia phage Octobien14 TaxID=2483673 RepID=A0A3G3M9U3_9CAUD|nr:hypothetical protein L3Y22_gp092 [Gordonia phage Octobien14]AYR03236.1 hypothetical protein SEA_OCTOBIEN14_92 [Gordonia phage Octobien14]
MADGSWWALENPGRYRIESLKCDVEVDWPAYSFGSLESPRPRKYLTLIELTNGRTTTVLKAYTDPDTDESIVAAYGKGQLKELSVYLDEKPDAFSWRKIH